MKIYTFDKNRLLIQITPVTRDDNGEDRATFLLVPKGDIFPVSFVAKDFLEGYSDEKYPICALIKEIDGDCFIYEEHKNFIEFYNKLRISNL